MTNDIAQTEADIINIEEYGKRGEPPPKGCRYMVRVDKATYVVGRAETTARALLTLAGKTPVEQYMLHQKIHGRLEELPLDRPIDLTAPGVERFITQGRDATEGLDSARREFQLPSEDRKDIAAMGYEHELVLEGNVRRLVIYGYPVPDGYNVDTVDLYLRLEPAYPDAQIDMVYFSPALVRRDGKPIGALSTEAFDGKVWQRWSRHRTAANPWRPGVDNIATHLAQVDDWLRRELLKR